jgi:hypothetical protein
MQTYDVQNGKIKYLNWQYTWWNGVYTIMLTKASILHQRYLRDFFAVIPKTFLQHIDKHKNCEDIAMAYVVQQMVISCGVFFCYSYELCFVASYFLLYKSFVVIE